MNKGPLVTSALILATILIVLSIAVVILPEHVAVIGMVAGAVAVVVIVVMLLMLIRMRGSI